jgi:arylsulfatase A-like enzyme
MNMNRRKLLMAGLAGVIGGAGATAFTLREREPKPRKVPTLPSGISARSRPFNILLVVTDQERFDLPESLALPAHERLRAKGMSFNRFHVNTTPCSPSRSNLYFGQHTQKTRMIVNQGLFPVPEIPNDMPSLGDYLRANGYYTAYKGKWHLSDIHGRHELTYGRYPSSRDALEPFGFSDYNFDGDPHGSTWTGYKYDGQIAAEASQWLRQRPQQLSSKPWMLAVNFVNPHDVMYFSTGESQDKSRRAHDYLSPIAPPPDDPLYRPFWDLSLPINRHDDLRSKPWAQSNYIHFCNMAYGQLPESDQDTAWHAYQSYYFNCIRDADRHLLTVLDALEASGQAERTIIIFTSDHGEMAGAHGLRQKGPFMYQENTRVPFIVVHPDVKTGAETTALGSTVDIVPTLLELAGVHSERIHELYPQLAGVSLASAVSSPQGTTERDQRGVLFNYNTTHYIDSQFIAALMDHNVTSDRFMPLRALKAGMWQMPNLNNPALFRGIHEQRYKFARYFRPSEHHKPIDWQTLTAHNQLELYDTHTDPAELKNLAHQPETVKPLLMALNDKLNQLVAREVGEDLGDEQLGFSFMKRL